MVAFTVPPRRLTGTVAPRSLQYVSETGRRGPGRGPYTPGATVATSIKNGELRTAAVTTTGLELGYYLVRLPDEPTPGTDDALSAILHGGDSAKVERDSRRGTAKVPAAGDAEEAMRPSKCPLPPARRTTPRERPLGPSNSGSPQVLGLSRTSSMGSVSHSAEVVVKGSTPKVTGKV